MKPLVTYPDPEIALRALLDELIAPHEPTATVTVGVPTDWTPASPPHLEVAWDGTPNMTHPVVAHATIRVVVRAKLTTDAKRIAALAQGLLLAHDGSDGISVIRPLTGILPARDPLTEAELASFTVRASVRSTPIELPSS